jgi:hypothetical protein
MMPQSAIPVALFFFDVGVEIGQFLFIAAVFAVVALGRQVLRRIAGRSGRGPGAFLRMPSAASLYPGSSSELPLFELIKHKTTT